ncbi:Alpha/beta hydrolase fold protein [Candidatus Filomicrobium marinum]|uniref:Alpha/beta hydrolase fold protein n=1 Tax=Candidatus Filomicrobium marinum TaxID=1608628 RepID=A0A0D6JLS8_9HYPH|nr:alpha/beta hydrolase [Candidatus Filomicrobium marinum]CFX64971.1 Alpha/beta hydrolase fold protein [Candidatus Filomicrobium marinum]CPR22620.1 Alpha/beta hydrolase fold protein [Candidatus Filomicrobium marinum]
MERLREPEDLNPQRLQLDDGRVFGLTRYGDPSGIPVLAIHGAPASRLMFEVAGPAARARGLQLICPDRPGYGLSPVDHRPTLAQRAEQLEAIAHHLGLDRMAVCAVSGGAPYAVALAARLAHRITALALVSPMGPIADMYAALGEEEGDAGVHASRAKRRFFMELPKRRRALRAVAAVAARGFNISPKLSARLFARLLNPADTATLSQPHVEASLIKMTREALRQGVVGGLADLDIFARPWGVDFGAIHAPTFIWQGTDDRIVPVEAALWLGAQLPDCSVERIEGAGHFWIYDHIDTVLTQLARTAGKTGKCSE